MISAPIVNHIFGVLTVLGQALILVLAISLFTKQPAFTRWVSRYGLMLAGIVAVVAVLGSLTYSDILGYEPCKLCWFQRIFMYPQAFILVMAWFKKDYRVVPYAITLSMLGAILSAYHYLLQLGVAPALPCSAVGFSASCSQRFVMQYGYITIPMMALTAFVLILLFLLLQYRRREYGDL